MELTARYRVGQRLRHPQFGEGLVVEVHTDRGREMLEVVFEGQLRRLSAQREWEVVEKTVPHTESMDGEETIEVQPGEQVARSWHPQTEALLDRWRAGDIAPMANFQLRTEAERWSDWAGADRLISLDSLRGVERFPHQIRACLRVLRDRHLRTLKDMGFSGIQNFPTVGLMDGVFRQNLEETGMSYKLEVECVARAREMDILTTPYVFNTKEAEWMAKAGADVLVALVEGAHVARVLVVLDDFVAVCHFRLRRFFSQRVGPRPTAGNVPDSVGRPLDRIQIDAFFVHLVKG